MQPGAAGAEPAAACPGGARAVAVAETVDGPVRRGRGDAQAPLARGAALCPGDLLTTGEGGRAELRFLGRDTTLGITANTVLRLPEAGPDARLEYGLLRFLSSVRGAFSVSTRHGNAGIDGTEALLALADGSGAGLLVLVREGEVTLSGAAGRPIALAAGDAGFAPAGGAPGPALPERLPPALRRLAIDPEGAADWAVYYPPLLLAAGLKDARLDAAARRLAADDPDGAESLLARIPARGRVGAAALALRAVVAVRRGRREEARGLADRAAALDPRLGAAEVARSYALQAAGEIEAALAAARRAATLAPEDAYALARRAELELILGRAGRARATARQAAAIAPLPLARAIEGFAALALFRDAEARTAFEAAIALEDGAPLPRLGLGLARIRAGETAAGRRDIELAASLDPRRAELRTWLGRAFFEEGLAAKARAQFDLARRIDPDDPRPWLFSAAERYAANSPLEAVRDIETAQALAPARSPLRGALGLGEDRAVAAAALGRALDATGAAERALDSGARAIEQDPTSGGAHRVLADLATGRPGLSYARTSAALRASLLSPPSLAPVEAGRAEPDLARLEPTGPARAAFGDFGPFFDRYGWAGRVSAFAGTQGTLGEQLSLTAAQGGAAIGLGQLHYRTDGYGPTDDLSHTVASLEGTFELGPAATLFAEAGARRSVAGDRALSTDPALDDPALETRDRRLRGRLGAHLRPAPGHDLLAVATLRAQRLESQRTSPAGDFVSVEGTPLQRDRTEASGAGLQVQHIGRFGAVTTVAGLHMAREDRTSRGSIEDIDFAAGGPPFSLRPVPTSSRLDYLTYGAYGYATYRLAPEGLVDTVEITAGLGIERFEDLDGSALGGTAVSPKGGVRLGIGRLSLRAAYTETLTPPLLFADRLEPVTVAGVAQYRPEAPGSEVRQAMDGAALRLAPWASLGAEGGWRRIEAAEGLAPGAAEEVEGRLTADLRLGSAFALGLRAERLDIASTLPGDPDDYTLARAGAELRYFSESGLFARIGLDRVRFESRDNDGSGQARDRFLLGTLGLGYRLPRGRGVVSLDVTNAFDADVVFRERPIRAFGADILDPVIPRDFTVFASVTLSF